jgi:hypothetical protein
MRFAYIDSNGNEVPIPSVDALALRIELGAINENTELYDAQADQWGPAHTHEIFHTLSRDVDGGEEGFVAPPPRVPPVTGAPPEEKGKAADGGDDGPTAGLTLADPPPPPSEEEEAAESVGDTPTFDFGDLTGGLEMEAVEEPQPSPDPEAPEAVMDFSGTPEDPDVMEDPGFGSDLEQPTPFDSAPGGIDPTVSAGLDLEPPMSEFRTDEPPTWMEPPETEVGDDVMDFSSVSNDPPTAERKAKSVAAAPRARPKKAKPSKPRRAGRQRSLVAPIVGVVLLAALGVGGYVAWPIVSSRFSPGAGDTPPTVVLPTLADEAMPRYQAAAVAAFATLISDARASVTDGVDRPSEDWLAGVYFANASRYAEVESFWLGVQDELSAVRDAGEDDFMAAFEASLSSAGVSSSEMDPFLARARVAYDVSSRAREETFDAVEQLIDVALGLHDFLIANEDDIQHTPASTLTVDPVLEARASTPAVNQGLEQRIGEVTSALDRLDYLNLVTRDGLWSAVVRRLGEVGIR